MSTYNAISPHRIVDLGPAWAGNIVNCVPFRADGLISRGRATWGAFYDDAGTVAVFRVEPDGRVAIARSPSPTAPDDAHRALSVGLDGERLLVIGGAHACDVFQFAFDAETLTPRTTPRLVHDGAPIFTYPTFCTDPSGGLLLLMRLGSAHRSRWCVWRLEGDNWVPDGTSLVDGMAPPPFSSGPYLSRPFQGAAGRLWTHCVWRLLPGAAGPSYVANVGVDLFGSDDGWRTLRTFAGMPLARPLGPAASERVVAVPHGRGLLNQTGGAAGPGGIPLIASCWSEPADGWQYRIVRPEGGGWRVSPASDFASEVSVEGIGTLALPHGRPELLCAPNGDAVVIFRSRELGGRLAAHRLRAPDFDLADAKRTVLWDQDLGEYEPVLDRVAWAEQGMVRLYVQRAVQKTGTDGAAARESAPAYVMDWRLE